MLLSLEQSFSCLLAGRYGDARLAPPLSGPSVYARVAKLALDHGLDPLGDPEELAAAEGLQVIWAPTPNGCAARVGDMIFLRWHRDAKERGLRLTHERAHAHLSRHGHPRSTEADALFATIALAMPPSERGRLAEAEHIPDWLIRLVQEKRRAA